MQNNAIPPPYFNVERPAHFRVRPDLIEELCVPEIARASLPKTEKQYSAWRQISNIRADQFPLERTVSMRTKPYEATDRYILRPLILAGQARVSTTILDAHGIGVFCESGGLWDFVINRAVEFAVWKRLEEPVARAMLLPNVGRASHTTNVYATWTIGYERRTGLCTLLARDHGDTERLYLAREGCFYTPFPEANEPLF